MNQALALTEPLLEPLPLAKEKILFLDLDHTLFLNPFWPSVFPEIARRVSEEKGARPEEVTTAIMSYSRALLRTRSTYSHDWDEVVKKVLRERFSYDWTKPLVEMVEEGVESSQLLDGANEALAQAKDLGWTLIAASQGFRRYQEPVIRYLGLDKYFSDLRFTDDVGILKRNRLFYGVVPEGSHVVVLGDKYIDDCLYPENFGFAGIWYTGLYRDKEVGTHLAPRAEISSLKDLSSTLLAVEPGLEPYFTPSAEDLCPLCLGAERQEGQEACRLCRETGLS